MVPLAASLDRLKRKRANWLMADSLPAFAPLGPMLDNPVRQCPLKADVLARLFRFNPLVLKDFLALCLELAVKGGIL